MKRYRVYQVDAFTTELLRGDPAGVVPDADGLTEEQMQALARELNNSETAFILSPTAPDHEVWVRFFTPTTEVPSCGHATIAAHYVRAREKRLSACTVVQKIGAGILPVEIIPVGPDDYQVVMTQGAIEFGRVFSGDRVAEITSALGLAASDLDARCPIQIVSTGHSKVLIGIRERSTLNALRPDLTRLIGISHEIGCNGYYVFTLTPGAPDVLAHGRMFAPAIGIAEDPVTGNANGPLGAFLVKYGLAVFEKGQFAFKAQQGEAIGRTGIVEVTVSGKGQQPERVKVAGRAVIVFSTEIQV